MRKLAAVFTVLSAVTILAACSSAAPTEGADGTSSEALDQIDAKMHVQWQRGFAHGGGGGGGSSNLVDHGGRVLPASHAYAIYWGGSSAFPSDLQSGISSLFDGMTSSSFLGISNQYMRGAAASTLTYEGAYTDTTAPPSRGPATSAIVGEACNVINANHLTADPAAVYFVFTSNFPSGHVSYCAWHSSGTCNGQTIQVAYMPNTTGMAGCDPGDLYACNSYSQGTRSVANVTSHEFMEAITDADPGATGAWTDSSGSEIGDKCAWQFASCVGLSTGNWQLQKEWSNAITGCQQK